MLPSNENSLNPNAREFVPNSSRPIAPQQRINPAYPPQATQYSAFNVLQYGNPYLAPTIQYGAFSVPQYGNPYLAPAIQYDAPQVMSSFYPMPWMPYGNPYTVPRLTPAPDIQAAPPSIQSPEISLIHPSQTMDSDSYDPEQFSHIEQANGLSIFQPVIGLVELTTELDETLYSWETPSSNPDGSLP